MNVSPTQTEDKKRQRTENGGDRRLEAREAHLLDWSDKQRRILTANGAAPNFFTPERGFAYKPEELPHHWLSQSKCQEVFKEWSQELMISPSSNNSTKEKPLIVGAWSRPLFYGGWEHSTDETETVFNVQTNSLFVDLRLPVSRLQQQDFGGDTHVSSLKDLSAHQLRLYARQHCFAGFTVTQDANKVPNTSAKTDAFAQVCTRHHCIDWNFVGTPRNRPNKWWVQIPTRSNHDDVDDGDKESISAVNVWKEWAYSTDNSGQHYYCERWERLRSMSLPDFPEGIVLAFQKREGREGILVVVNDHFNYCLGRSSIQNDHPMNTTKASLVQAVDECVENDDLIAAQKWLSIQGGHGLVSSGWMVDAALEFWVQGTSLWSRNEVRLVNDINSTSDHRTVPWWQASTLYWKEDAWDVVECNLDSFQALESFLKQSLK